MRAICLNCTLKRSPEPSSTASLADVVLAALREEGVETDEIRLVDHLIEPGVVSEAVRDGDEWPAIRERLLAAEILIVATPTWLGQPSSVTTDERAWSIATGRTAAQNLLATARALQANPLPPPITAGG